MEGDWAALSTLFVLEAGVPFCTGLLRSSSLGDPGPEPLDEAIPSAELRFLVARLRPLTCGFLDLNKKDIGATATKGLRDYPERE